MDEDRLWLEFRGWVTTVERVETLIEGEDEPIEVVTWKSSAESERDGKRVLLERFSLTEDGSWAALRAVVEGDTPGVQTDG